MALVFSTLREAQALVMFVEVVPPVLVMLKMAIVPNAETTPTIQMLAGSEANVQFAQPRMSRRHSGQHQATESDRRRAKALKRRCLIQGNTSWKRLPYGALGPTSTARCARRGCWSKCSSDLWKLASSNLGTRLSFRFYRLLYQLPPDPNGSFGSKPVIPRHHHDVCSWG
jgi:hypothetical protein